VYTFYGADGTFTGKLIVTFNEWSLQANQYEAEVSDIWQFGEYPIFFGGPAAIEGDKLTIKDPDNPDAQVVITMTGGAAELEANDEARRIASDSVGGGNTFDSLIGAHQVKYFENWTAALLDWLAPGYLPDKDDGKFEINPDYNGIKITGDNVRLRQAPNTESEILTLVHEGDYNHGYYGEWTNPKGEKWFLTDYWAEVIGEYAWVHGNYAVPLH
jgi:hypothetical protein